ncbi:Rv3235 family protein [Microbispora sp. NBC_01189]|uniref:Rv3235 family protein n=1 Tax=Microbispora sp. NBC_01189 TaxID=2903583 RepID=UPI002E1441AE|nr:Rv3235 family protein [Microbispora sp. NBC_01189]
MPKPVPLPRLAAVPPADPPYDERDGGPVTYGALALAPATLPAPPVSYPYGRPGGSLTDERRLRGLGQALAEILAGRRPPETVAGRLTERAYRELVRAGKMIDTERPPLTGLPHVQRPLDGVIEMCLLVNCGPRSRVLAVRLERQGMQWLVTDFETA